MFEAAYRYVYLSNEHTEHGRFLDLKISVCCTAWPWFELFTDRFDCGCGNVLQSFHKFRLTPSVSSKNQTQPAIYKNWKRRKKRTEDWNRMTWVQHNTSIYDTRFAFENTKLNETSSLSESAQSHSWFFTSTTITVGCITLSPCHSHRT